MCGALFAPKPKAVAAPPPPAPPAPPAAEPPISPALNENDRRDDSERDGRVVRRIGRKALRIDLQAPGVSGHGLQTPKS